MIEKHLVKSNIFFSDLFEGHRYLPKYNKNRIFPCNNLLFHYTFYSDIKKFLLDILTTAIYCLDLSNKTTISLSTVIIFLNSLKFTFVRSF